MDDLPELDLDDDDALSQPDGDSDMPPQNWDMGAVESIATIPNPRNQSVDQGKSNTTIEKKPFDINKVTLRDSIDDEEL